mmetsp:Transcript_13152/g.29220  ORF Transcript_13152/g.29220 Transcript_13152/m.29220 type:complete len:273 (-) Transcript_13152:191-1009(-)
MGDEEEEPKYWFEKKAGNEWVKGVDSKTLDGDFAKVHYIGKEGEGYTDEYDGTFAKGKRSGIGEYRWKHGDVYKGQWNNDERTGLGVMTYSAKDPAAEEDGDEGVVTRGGRYHGWFENGLRSTGDAIKGIPPRPSVDHEDHEHPTKEGGTFTYYNGDVYSGQWLEGKKHGQGTYLYAGDKTRMEGRWENGKMAHGKWIFPNGRYYVGQFRYNKPFGKGTWCFPNGNQVSGEYIQTIVATEEEGGEEEGEVKEKPDPPVTCTWKSHACVTVRG